MANFSFANSRAQYVINVTAQGSLVIDKTTQKSIIVPFGDAMDFAGVIKYSKDSLYIVHHVESHLESYAPIESLIDMPVDFLRTGMNSSQVSTPNTKIPDRADKVIVAYVNSAEYTNIGHWDPSFNPAWDKDNDAIIDAGTTNLPDYVDVKVFNGEWGNYVAAYWTDSWKQQLESKIDAAAAQNFDGVMLDVMTGYLSWKSAYPNMDVNQLRQETVKLFKAVSQYAKSTYGSEFIVSANLDDQLNKYFLDAGKYIDVGYYQNAFFDWTGSGVVDGTAVTSTSTTTYINEKIDFLKSQGMAVLDMDHLGTGTVSPGLSFTNYDSEQTPANYMKLFDWAIQSGSTPFSSPVFMGEPYVMTPHFVRIDGIESLLTNTNYDDWVIGNDLANKISTGMGNDVINAGLGDDTITAGSGDDRIDGGGGQDTANFSQNLSEYTITKTENNYTVHAKSGVDGTDSLIHVENLRFQDITVNLKIQNIAKAAPSIDVQNIIELYIAFFNRTPDADGLAYWIQQKIAGQSIYQISESFYSAGTSAEYSALTGFSSNMNNEDFINVFYKNVLGRSQGADAEGLHYWVNKLANGSSTRSSLAIDILNSAHTFKGNINYGYVADLLDNKIAVAHKIAIDWGITYNTDADSYTHGVAIAAAVTSNSIAPALSLVGVSATDMILL